MNAEPLILIGIATVVAAFVQGSAGFGFALIVAPVVGLLEPSLLPVLLLVLMIPLNAYVAWRERGAVDKTGAGWITAGRVVGTAGGLWVLVAVSGDRLGLLIGGTTVLAAVVSLVAPAFTPGRTALITTGVVTGITETSTGIGGPPLALIYQHRPAPVLRSTVAICFLLGELISLAVLAVGGRVTSGQVYFALLILPAVGVGALFSRIVHRRVGGRVMRVLVLGFALVSGVAVLLRS